MYGTLADFKMFLREAHRRGLRVITELVAQPHVGPAPVVSTRAPRQAGSRWRNFYVWSDDTPTNTRMPGSSSRTWKRRTGPGIRWRRRYFWHRFFSHQPDLNYDNPEVHEAIFKVVDFWLDLGVDGLRLDAVPYLYEREGTSCENLPETHAFLKNVARARGRKVRRPHVAGRSQSMARGRRGLFRPGPRRRMPHGVSFSAHAAPVHGAAHGGPPAHRGYPRADAADSGDQPVGACSCAITTS